MIVLELTSAGNLNLSRNPLKRIRGDIYQLFISYTKIISSIDGNQACEQSMNVLRVKSCILYSDHSSFTVFAYSLIALYFVRSICKITVLLLVIIYFRKLICVAAKIALIHSLMIYTFSVIFLSRISISVAFGILLTPLPVQMIINSSITVIKDSLSIKGNVLFIFSSSFFYFSRIASYSFYFIA